MEQIQVSIQGKPYNVIGGKFYDMLVAVKAIPGRQYLQKVWQLPLTLEEARVELAPLQVVDEDGQLEAEIADIQQTQALILAQKVRIEQWIVELDDEIARFSRNSVSSIKHGRAVQRACLQYALEYALLPLEKLTEPQIKTMYAAMRDLEGRR